MIVLAKFAIHSVHWPFVKDLHANEFLPGWFFHLFSPKWDTQKIVLITEKYFISKMTILSIKKMCVCIQNASRSSDFVLVCFRDTIKTYAHTHIHYVDIVVCIKYTLHRFFPHFFLCSCPLFASDKRFYVFLCVFLCSSFQNSPGMVFVPLSFKMLA